VVDVEKPRVVNGDIRVDIADGRRLFRRAHASSTAVGSGGISAGRALRVLGETRARSPVAMLSACRPNPAE
jgi:hypothetical protein